MLESEQRPTWTGQDLRRIRGAWHRETQIQAPTLPLAHRDLSFASYLGADLACKTGKTIPALFTLREDDLYESIM